MKSDKPKIIFIDWNNTLSYSKFWHRLADENNPLNQHHDMLIKWLFIDHKNLVLDWMLGKGTTQEIVLSLAKELNIPFNLLHDELSYSCTHMEFCHPEVPVLLKNIRKKSIKLVVATDNMDTFRNHTIPGMSLDAYFDDYLISSELRTFKDTQEQNNGIKFFDEFLKKHNAEYDEVLLLDDSPDSSGIYAKYHFSRKLITSRDNLLNELRLYATN